MTKQTLIKSLKNLTINTGIDIQGKKFDFAIRCLKITDRTVITFGGYTLHFQIYDITEEDVYTIEEVAEEFIKYISEYEENLKNCKIDEIEEF